MKILKHDVPLYETMEELSNHLKSMFDETKKDESFEDAAIGNYIELPVLLLYSNYCHSNSHPYFREYHAAWKTLEYRADRMPLSTKPEIQLSMSIGYDIYGIVLPFDTSIPKVLDAVYSYAHVYPRI